jgi:hypothetical protein
MARRMLAGSPNVARSGAQERIAPSCAPLVLAGCGQVPLRSESTDKHRINIKGRTAL